MFAWRRLPESRTDLRRDLQRPRLTHSQGSLRGQQGRSHQQGWDLLRLQHRSYSLRAPMAAAQCRQSIYGFPVGAMIDCLFHQPCSLLCEHRTGEVPELSAQLVFGERLIKIAPVTVAALRRASAISENHRYARWPQPRCYLSHSWILGDRDTMAERHDRWVLHRCIIQRRVTRMSPNRHCGSRMRERVFGGEEVWWVGIAHDGSEP